MQEHTRIIPETVSPNHILIGMALSVFLSFLSMVEYTKVAHGIFSAWDSWHYANMAGLAPSPLQQRVLSFLIPEALHQGTGLSILHAYLLERFVFLSLAGAAMFILALRFVSIERSLTAIIIFFLFYNLSALPHIQPAEEINIFIFSVSYILIDSRRFGLLLLTAAIGAAAKTTIIFIAPIYFIFSILTRRGLMRTILETSILTGVIGAIAIGIAYHYSGPRDYLGGFWQYAYNTKQLTKLVPQNFPFIFISLVPMGCIIISWKKQPVIIQSTALVCPLFVIGHYLISRVEEFRTFMPLAVTLFIGLLIFSSQLLQAHSNKAKRE